MWTWLDTWTSRAQILEIGAIVLALMAVAALFGVLMRALHDRAIATTGGKPEETHEGPTVTAVLTLLALLLGFTFNLSMERFEARRRLVVDEANAIGTTYLRAQLLPEPHRKRISDILVAYTDNRIAFATIGAAQEPQLLARNDALLTDLWAATSAALDSIDRPDFSNAFLTSTNNLIDLDVARKAARLTKVPGEVYVTLFAYMIATAGLLGYLLIGFQGRLTAGLVLVLMALFLLLVVDIDRPMQGGIRESQVPMQLLRASLAAQPPQVFDRYRPAAATSPRPSRRPAP